MNGAISIAPKLKRDANDQIEFGYGDTKRFLNAMANGELQAPPVKNSAGGFNVPCMGVSPGDSAQFHMSGSPLWAYKRFGPLQVFFDTPTLMYITTNQVYNRIRYNAAVRANTVGAAAPDKLKKEQDQLFDNYFGNLGSNGKEDKIDMLPFTDLSAFRQRITLAGVKADEPDGYSSLQQGTHKRLEPDNVFALAFYSRQHMHISHFDAPHTILVGAPLWVIIKKVPITWCTVYDAAKSDVMRYSEKEKESSREMAIVCLFYASPDGHPPPRHISADTYTKTQEQPPLYTTSYMEYPDPSKPKEFKQYEGHLIFLGLNAARVPARSKIAYTKRKEVLVLPQSEMIKGGLIDSILNIKPKFC